MASIREEILNSFGNTINFYAMGFLNNFYCKFKGGAFRSLNEKDSPPYINLENQERYLCDLLDNLKKVEQREANLSFEEIRELYKSYFKLRDKLLPALEKASQRIKDGETNFEIEGDIQIIYNERLNDLFDYSAEFLDKAISLLKDDSVPIGDYNHKDSLISINSLLTYLVQKETKNELEKIIFQISNAREVMQNKEKERITQNYFTEIAKHSSVYLSQTMDQFYSTIDNIAETVFGSKKLDNFKCVEYPELYFEIYIRMRELGYTHQELI